MCFSEKKSFRRRRRKKKKEIPRKKNFRPRTNNISFAKIIYIYVYIYIYFFSFMKNKNFAKSTLFIHLLQCIIVCSTWHKSDFSTT